MTPILIENSYIPVAIFHISIEKSGKRQINHLRRSNITILKATVAIPCPGYP